jgi:hypothetical protein
MMLDADSVDAIARRVVELLHGEDVVCELVDAAEVARRLGVDRAWVYDHADELGAIRLGKEESKRPRLRFDPRLVAERMAPRPFPGPRDPKAQPSPWRRSSQPSTDLLPIRGES